MKLLPSVAEVVLLPYWKIGTREVYDPRFSSEAISNQLKDKYLKSSSFRAGALTYKMAKDDYCLLPV